MHSPNTATKQMETRKDGLEKLPHEVLFPFPSKLRRKEPALDSGGEFGPQRKLEKRRDILPMLGPAPTQ